MFRKVIPCFWTKYPLPSTAMKVLMLAIYISISSAALIGNGLVIILWIK